MAEAPKEPAKKKGKMPMIIALVVMLGAGGFFGSKMGGGGAKKEEPKIELGEVVPLGEFLVNLSDGRTFLKTDIAVQISKTGHLDEAKGGHEGKAEPPAAVRDAVISVLSSETLDDISSPEGKLALKKAIAKAINAVAPKEEEKDKDKDKKKKKKKKESDEEDVIDESWDSQTGPVLKVYFTSFATQQ